MSDTAVASLIYAARDAAVTARDAAELARDGAVAALASITNQISAALPMVYTFQVGGDVQSADVENAEVTKHHVLWMALDGVLQNEDTFNVTEGLITPVDGDWPEVTLQVKLGIGMPISIAAAVPLMQSVRNVQVADDAAIEATKLSYTALAAPYVKRSVSEKFREVRSLADYGGKGNGTFDNSAAWADAIDDAMSFPNGGTIYLPAGHYGAGSSISFPKTAGKWLRVVGEGAGTVIDVSGVADHAWYVGGALAAGGTNFRAEQLQFVGQSQTGKTAIRLENANGAQFENIFLDTMNDGFDMTDSYAVSFVGIQTVNVGRYSIYSNTPAHNTIIDRCKAFNAGVANSGCFLWIDGHTDNLVVQNSDFESCRQIFNLADGGSSARFVGNYTEYCVTDPFGFGTGVYGLDMSNNWLSFGAAFEFTKWFGGAFQRNRLFNQNIFWNSTCRDVQTGGNRLSGTSTMQPFPAQAISAFLNGSSVGARPITYFKDQGGFVHLTGELVVGANGSPAFSLPAGYRPIPAGIHPRFSTVSAVDNKSAFLIADSSNGNIVPTCSGNQTITLDGIIFKAE
ncbi:glycosyl hydrolase family 28-related protein [Rhizobium sp. WW_1]|uniref:glycosyl hydrolase family 28-related protein n=1 Tax=Rhizobium sp. WW_1 TaxID=1907375 RepID=UPI0006457A45|nr:glycosyl hydrolase family 28-related protein [Rhizobium sp. WW_1]